MIRVLFIVDLIIPLHEDSQVIFDPGWSFRLAITAAGRRGISDKVS
jgi:hypothetical protein